MDAWLITKSKPQPRDSSPTRHDASKSPAALLGSPLTSPVPAPDTPAELTQEQRERIEANRQAALAKLAAKNPYNSLEKALLEGSWYNLLEEEFKLTYWNKIQAFLAEEHRTGKAIYPSKENIFAAYNACPLSQVRVVILGQDPYHGPGQAMGLSFSVPRGVRPPPSLVNIFKELKDDLGDSFTAPAHGDLSAWAGQGVFLLNTTLTVRAHEAASHAGCGWSSFTEATLRHLNRSQANIVFVLWGSHALKLGKILDKAKHQIVSSVHPSPLSARNGFFGSKFGSKVNAYLSEHGKGAIDWNLPC